MVDEEQIKGLLEIALDEIQMKERRVGYADIRIVDTREQDITVMNGQPQPNELHSLGAGIRILYRSDLGDGWGFADTDVMTSASIRETAGIALKLARGASTLGSEIVLADEPVYRGEWVSPTKKDPFDVSTEEKTKLLIAATDEMTMDSIVSRRADMRIVRSNKYFANTEGSRITQRITHTGAGISAAARQGSETQIRSYPNSFRGQHALMGYELVEDLDLVKNAKRVASEAIELLSAVSCPKEKMDLILSGNQIGLQVHESAGHPTELDRALGHEANFAGRSFLTPDKLGMIYGSKEVNIVLDATPEHGPGLGTFMWDDEGVKSQRTYAVKEGVFEGFLMSRETAAECGYKRSNGCMRAQYYKLPIVRMTNVSLLPGNWSPEEIIGEVKHGIFMDTNRSWSIDQKRYNFQFSCELGHLIKDGDIGPLVKNPTYGGITPEFWQSCYAVGKDWKLWGTPNCGKGQPQQVMSTGHGGATTGFKKVQIGMEI